MKTYTIRELEGGCIVCTGYEAETEDEEMDQFIADHPAYSADDFYAAEANWND